MKNNDIPLAQTSNGFTLCEIEERTVSKTRNKEKLTTISSLYKIF